MDFRTRAQWGAVFDVSGIPTFRTPVSMLFIHHNVMPPTNNPNDDMRRTEAVDISRFGLPSYKWAIHPSGVVLEGMTNHSSPDTYGHNSDALSIMFMGNFENDQPTSAAILACRELVQVLRDFNLLTKDFRILGHRDVYSTACPGRNLYPRLGELIVPPTIMSSPMKTVGKDNMVLQDPTTKGIWVVTENGAVFAYDGAPYLGGTNNAKYNAANFPCVGIVPFSDSHGDGYTLVLDFGNSGGDRFRRFRFSRDSSSRV